METRNNKNKNEAIIITASIIAVFAFFAVILIIPATRGWFEKTSNAHPYLMGFVKFGLLATAGELISIRLGKGAFKKPPYLIARIVIWGLIGIWITYMMKMFYIGSGALIAAGLLPGKSLDITGFGYKLIRAFATSATMNLTFGPTFMAVHKCSDTYLALRAERGKGVKLSDVINAVDWNRFVSFTLLRTVPIFWIPAHTVTFLLPPAYQVMLAALLSVALGIILNLRKKSPAPIKEESNIR